MTTLHVAPPQSKTTNYKSLAVALLLVGFALRVHGLGAKSLWYDELRQIEVAQLPIGRMQPMLLAHAARPLDYMLLHFWLGGGHQEFWLRFPAMLWATLALALTFALALRLFGRSTALLALGLVGASPFAVQYAQEQRPYALFLLATLASTYCLELALRKGQRWAWLGFGLAAAAGTLTHFFFIFVLAAQMVYGVVGLAARRPRAGWKAWVALSSSAALGLAALFAAARPAELVGFAEQFAGALGHASTAGGLVSDTGSAVRVTETINRDFFVQGLLPAFGAGEAPAGWLLFNGLALFGLLGLALKRPRHLALVGLWLFGAPALVIIYLQYRQQFFAQRYVLFALPIYLVLAALGVVWLIGRPRTIWSVRTAVGALLVVSLLVLDLRQVVADYAKPKEDWRRVGQFLALNTRPGDTLGAPDVQAFVRFYAPSQAAVIVDANDLGPHQEALANGERFWFVWSRYTLLPVDETRKWVESLPGVSLQLDPDIKVIYVHPGVTQVQMLAEAERFTIPPPSLP